MKSTVTCTLFVLAGLFLFSCGGSQEQEAGQQENAAETETEAASEESGEETKQVTAKFIEFSLGDASHFKFEDESGKIWDFAGNEDENYRFAMELPEAEVNETNQGWGSDKSLQGKWFEILYVYRTQPEYPDGPMKSVPVIMEATLKE